MSPRKIRTIDGWILKFTEAHKPDGIGIAELCDLLDKPAIEVIDCCRKLLEKNKIHKVDGFWRYGPEPSTVAPKIERFIPGPLPPTKHWSDGIPSERMAAFKLPSRVGSRLVYPKGYSNDSQSLR